MLEPVVKDLSVAWGNFDEALTNCKEKCYSDLTKLLENIRTDFNGRRLQSDSWAIGTRILTGITEMDGVAAEPMLPFLASLTIKKAQLRKQLEVFFDQVKSTSR